MFLSKKVDLGKNGGFPNHLAEEEKQAKENHSHQEEEEKEEAEEEIVQVIYLFFLFPCSYRSYLCQTVGL